MDEIVKQSLVNIIESHISIEGRYSKEELGALNNTQVKEEIAFNLLEDSDFNQAIEDSIIWYIQRYLVLKSDNFK